MSHRSLRQIVTAIALLVAFLSQGTWALAGTTGGVIGSVTDQTGKPVAGAKVTATAPSETLSTSTDSAGHFAFLSLAPDTYTLQVEKEGFSNQSITGVVIFADNSQTLAITLQPQLKTIANVTSRAASAIVKAGTTTDVYSVNASVAHAAQALGGGGSLNQAYSALAAVPGVFIPQGQSGWAQSVYIRGANYTQLGYEYDGVPIQRSFDQYPSGVLSSLGQQELQVYAGSAPTDAQSSAIGGFINQVIKTGTYPGFGESDLGYGTPSFYRKLSVEAGGATPDRLFSWYAGVGGYNQAFRYADQFNGQPLDPEFGSAYNFVAVGCGTAHPSAGCYSNAAGLFGAEPLGPNGYALGPTFYGVNNMLFDRDVVANFHFALPHKHDGGRDDIQLLYSNSFLKTQFATQFNAWNYAANNVLNGTATYNGVNYPTCSGVTPGTPCAFYPGLPYAYLDTSQYTGPVGVQLTSGMLSNTSNYLQPGSPNRTSYDQLTPPNEADFYSNDSSVVKLQYQHNMGSNAFFRVYGYTNYSDWNQQALSGATLSAVFVGSVSPDYQLNAHTAGVAASLVDQISEKNQLNFTTGYTQASTARWNNAWYSGPSTIAVAVDSTNPTSGTCYSFATGTPAAVYCGASSVAGYSLPGVAGGAPIGATGPLAPKHSVAGGGKYDDPTVGTIGNYTCGGGPCEYFTVQSGLNGAYNTVKPMFTNASLNDTWRPNDRLTIDAGVAYDNFAYGLPNGLIAPAFESSGTAARMLWNNSVNQWDCFNPVSGLVKAGQATAPNVGGANNCASGFVPVNFSFAGASENAYQAWEPRAGLTYEINPFNVLRVSYGKYEQPSSSAFQQYLNANYNLFSGPALEYYPYGFSSTSHTIYPEISYNLDGSWEHQSKGTDFSFKISPFYRKTANEIFDLVLDPRTNYVGGLNVGRATVAGSEFLITKGDFNRNGFATQLSYTYTWGTVRFNNLPNGNTVVDLVNSSIAQYNSYTSFCANNPKNAECQYKGTTLTPTNGLAAAPCYTKAGAPDAACAAGSIANPYWNAPAQPLFNAGNEFFAYNTLPGAGATSTASSYIIPHVASLLLSYKHDKMRVSPSLQFSGGGKYGSPTQGIGIDPAAGGCTPLAAAVAGPIAAGSDPRYPYGAPGGSAYDASTCGSAIVTPDFASGRFDNFGAFTEPSVLAANLQVDYDVTPRITVSAVATNLLDTCFGGTNVPWAQNSRIGCWYTAGTYAGNFYNPGDTFQGTFGQPYTPTFGNTFQSAYGGQANPINLYVTARIKL